jgi:hypothetical protein
VNAFACEFLLLPSAQGEQRSQKRACLAGPDLNFGRPAPNQSEANQNFRSVY